MFLENPLIHWPSLPRMTHPPQLSVNALNTALSTFTLNHPCCGFSHLHSRRQTSLLSKTLKCSPTCCLDQGTADDACFSKPKEKINPQIWAVLGFVRESTHSFLNLQIAQTDMTKKRGQCQITPYANIPPPPNFPR